MLSCSVESEFFINLLNSFELIMLAYTLIQHKQKIALTNE